MAHLGGVDAGGQNVAVAELSAALARRGHDVVVYTRRDDPDLPERVDTEQGYAVVHLPAGRPLPFSRMTCCSTWQISVGCSLSGGKGGGPTSPMPTFGCLD